MARFVLTGATGFVGTRLLAMLAQRDHIAVVLDRDLMALPSRARDGASLEAAIHGADAVIHLAARAHVIVEHSSDPLEAFRHVNVAGTVNLARAAVRAGVPRFVFVSSIGVLGNSSGTRVFTESDVPAPLEPYAVSKLEAERELLALRAQSPFELVIVRPPLVYGPGVKGNFLRLLRLVASGWPLPFGGVHNVRDYVGLDNLCDFLLTVSLHPRARDELFLVADGHACSTAELLRAMAAAMGVRSRVLPCPPSLLAAAMRVVGKRAEFERLTANLRIDAGHARAKLHWQPVKDFEAGLAEMAEWFRGRRTQ